MNRQVHLIQNQENRYFELFDMLNESGVTIVMITHDRKVAERAKRIVHIIDGEISEEGQEVKHEEEKGN